MKYINIFMIETPKNQSVKFGLVTSEKIIVNLRNKIDKNISIVTGGRGSPCNIKGVSYIHQFDKYYDFLTETN